LKPQIGTKINLEVTSKVQIVISEDEKVKNMRLLKEKLWQTITHDYQPILFRALKKQTPEVTFMGAKCGLHIEPLQNVGFVRNSMFYGLW
jgi:hypothetical protein